MSIKLELPHVSELRPRLTVIGVGGAGCNAINNMIAAGLTGVEFVVANTDAQSLAVSSTESRIQLGARLTEGLGAGSKPEIGEAAAEEAIDDIRARVTGSHMVFIAAGMGGGTGTGAASVIARAAKELGVLTVGVVTKPFQFEGARRMRIAEAGIGELKKYVDTLIVIPNQNLFRIANEKTTFAEAFVLADQVLYSGVACIVDLIIKEGLINLDFADVRTVMSGMGTAMMGTGEATGERRAIIAAEEAISNPLLDDVTLRGARGLLLSITGGRDMTLYEVDEAASRVRQEVDPEANIIVGATFDEGLGDRVRVSIVASGMQRAGEPLQRHPGSVAAGGMAPLPQGPQLAPHGLQGSGSQGFAPQGHGAPGHHGSHGHGPQGQGPLVHPSQGGGPQGYAAQGQGYAAQEHGVPPGHSVPPEPAFARPRAPASGPGHADAPGPIGTAGESPRPRDPSSREPWRGPGNVMVEEYSPPLQPGIGASRLPATHPAPSAPFDANRADGFTPAPPADLRRPVRRMPEVEEFTVPGQRDYHAKAGTRAGAKPAARHGKMGHGDSPEVRGDPAREPFAPRKRSSLLGRLTGRQRESQSPVAARAPSGATPPAADDVDDGTDLPVFFNRERKQ